MANKITLILQDFLELAVEDIAQLIEENAQLDDWFNNIREQNMKVKADFENAKKVIQTHKNYMSTVLDEKREVEQLYHELKVLYDAGVKQDILKSF